MAQIHPTAIVASTADLAADVAVGAYSIIGPQVKIESGTSIDSHVVIEGRTSIGRGNTIHSFAKLGGVPQDKKYHGEPTSLEIGHFNTIREYVTINLGTIQDRGVTTVGDHNWVMAYVHIAHDCVVGNHTVFANCSQLAGHVRVADWVILGGFTGVHQFCQIGAHAMTAVGTVVVQDIPPYVLAAGDTATPRGINAEGLRRREFTAQQIQAIRQAYKTIYRQGLSLAEAKENLSVRQVNHPELAILLEFLVQTQRGIIR